MKSIETKHTNELLEAEKTASDNFGSKLSEIIQTITDKQREFSEQIDNVRKNLYL